MFKWSHADHILLKSYGVLCAMKLGILPIQHSVLAAVDGFIKHVPEWKTPLCNHTFSAMHVWILKNTSKELWFLNWFTRCWDYKLRLKNGAMTTWNIWTALPSSVLRKCTVKFLKILSNFSTIICISIWRKRYWWVTRSKTSQYKRQSKELPPKTTKDSSIRR